VRRALTEGSRRSPQGTVGNVEDKLFDVHAPDQRHPRFGPHLGGRDDVGCVRLAGGSGVLAAPHEPGSTWWAWYNSPQGNHQNPPLTGADAVMDPWTYTEADVRNIASPGVRLCLIAKARRLSTRPRRVSSVRVRLAPACWTRTKPSSLPKLTRILTHLVPI